MSGAQCPLTKQLKLVTKGFCFLSRESRENFIQSMAALEFNSDFGDCYIHLPVTENIVVNETIRENVMSVELAIKRELAYQRRVEKLQLEPTGDIKEVPRHPQCPPQAPGPSIIGNKRKEPSCSLQPQQQPQPSSSCQPLKKQTDDQFCKLCQVPFLNTFRHHRDSKEHKAKLETVKSRKTSGASQSNYTRWCPICNVPCCGEQSWLQHLAGKKHAAARDEKRTRGDTEREGLMAKWNEHDWGIAS